MNQTRCLVNAVHVHMDFKFSNFRVRKPGTGKQVSPLNAQIDGMNVGLTVNLQQSVSYVDQDKPGRAGSLSFDVLRKVRHFVN